VGREENRSNRTKHGVWFEEAQSAFRDSHARLFHDPEHLDEEDRFILIGVSSAARPLVVVHCYKESDFSELDHFRAEGNQEGVYIL